MCVLFAPRKSLHVTIAIAIALLANYAAAKGLAPWSPASNDTADIVLALVVLATPPTALRWPLRR